MRRAFYAAAVYVLSAWRLVFATAMVVALFIVATFGLGVLNEVRDGYRRQIPERIIPPQPSPDVDAEAQPHTLEELQSVVRQIAREDLVAGLSLALVEDGEIVWAEGFGVSDIERQRPATADTVYRVGSLSKSVLALTMASLEADGQLDLDAPLRDVVDAEFDNPWAATHPVRVTHLLQHTAAFDEMRFNEMFAERDELAWSTDRVLALNPNSRRARWRPGTRHSYSQPGYTMAGRVVEVVTGRPFADVVRERVFDPLLMRDAAFVPNAALEAELAVGYDDDRLEPAPLLYLHHRPGCHLYVSAREMARLIQLFAARGVVDGERIVDEAVIERMEHGATLPYGDLIPAYGLGLYAAQHGGVISFGHGGYMPGHYSGMRYVPSTRSGVVMMSNDPAGWRGQKKIDKAVLRYLQRGATPATPRPRVHLEPQELAALAGTYAREAPNVEFAHAFETPTMISVEVAGEDLELRFGDGETATLVPLGDGHFRGDNQVYASFAFSETADGTAVMFDGNGWDYCERRSELSVHGETWVRKFVYVAVMCGLFWLVIWIPSAIVREGDMGLRAWPSLGAWAVVLFVDTLYKAPLPELGVVCGRTILVFLLSWAIPICTGLAVLRTGRALLRRRARLRARIAAVFVTLGLVIVTVHFASHGLLGVRTWLW